MSSWTNRKEVETELEIGEECFNVTFTRVTKVDYDPNYGADADGHRGMPRTDVDEDYAEDIFVEGKALKDQDKEVQEKIQKAVDEWLENNEPDIEEPEPPCDDLGDDE